MNHLVFNTNYEKLHAIGCGNTGTNTSAFLADGQGKLQLSPVRLSVTASNLNIQDLSTAADQLTITATDLDIRNLSGLQDSILLYSRSTVTDSASATIIALSTVYLLTENVGKYSLNTFFIKNTGIGVAVTIALQLAPVDSDNYYVTDGSSFNLLAGGTVIFNPSKITKYARLQVSSLLLGSVQAFYFGQS